MFSFKNIGSYKSFSCFVVFFFKDCFDIDWEEILSF